MYFQPGNKMARGGARPGAGRKSAARKREFERLIQFVLPADRREAILEKITEAALQGDLKAAAFLFSHVYGRPGVRDEYDSEEEENQILDLSILSDEEVETLALLLRKAGGQEKGSLSIPDPLEME